MANENSMASNEAQIRQLIDDWATAFRAKDVGRIMSCYSPDVVAFDIVPPLQYRGASAYMQDWEQMLAMCDGPIGLEMHELTVAAGAEVGFCHCLNHFTGKQTNGREIDLWLRATVCYRKIDGKWLAAHEHVSAPIDMESGRALLDLKP